MIYQFLGDWHSSSSLFWKSKNLCRHRPWIGSIESIINKDWLNHLRMKDCWFILNDWLFLYVYLILIFIQGFDCIMRSLLKQVFLVVNKSIPINYYWLIHCMIFLFLSALTSAIMVVLENNANIILYGES